MYYRIAPSDLHPHDRREDEGQQLAGQPAGLVRQAAAEPQAFC